MNFNFRKWVDYFQNNKMNLQVIDWNDQYRLNPIEYRTIYSSIQQFQVGEKSEGKFLIEAAKKYLSKINDKSYLEALTLFIHEEQRHANELGMFMEKQNIPTIRKHWVDQVFRKLRRLANLEQSITVLLTAELIAAVYYDALKQNTKSNILIVICEQILCDETKHIEFQSITLSQISKNRKLVFKKILSFLRLLLLVGHY